MKLIKSVKDFAFKELKYGFFFNKRLKKIRDYENLSLSQLEEIEASLLSKQIRDAYKKSVFYRDLYDKHGVNISQIQTREDLLKLPTISKEAIRERVDDIYIGNRIKHTSYTSGTSGSPLKVYYDVNCILNEAAYNEFFRNNVGHTFGQKVVSLRGALDGSKKEYFDKSSNTLYLSSYHLKQDNVKWYYDKIKGFNPNCILAYPSSLETLAILFAINNYDIKIPLAFTSSETLYSYQQDKIEKILKTKIYDRYGNAERTISLIQSKNRGNYRFPKLYSINEFLSEGVIATTNLINPKFPLIRYVVNDIIKVNEFNEVECIDGRIDDTILTSDGLKIGGAAMSLAFKQSDNLLKAQIVQDSINKIKVNLVVNEKFDKHEEAFLHAKIRQKVGDMIAIEMSKVDNKLIIKTAKNKYKLIINNLN